MWDLALHTPFTVTAATHLIPAYCFEKAPIFPCIFVSEVDQADNISNNHWDTFFFFHLLHFATTQYFKIEMGNQKISSKGIESEFKRPEVSHYFDSSAGLSEPLYV